MNKVIYCTGILGRLVWFIVYGLIAIPLMIIVLFLQLLITGKLLPDTPYYEGNVNL